MAERSKDNIEAFQWMKEVKIILNEAFQWLKEEKIILKHFNG
jgi:hypothetical protein